MPKWLWLVAIYITWNLCGYLEGQLFKNSFLADCTYWTCERVFVLATWVTIARYIRYGVWHHYLWIIKTLIWVAALKLLYAILVMTGVLRINEGWILMGTFFVITLGYIIARWEKSRLNY